MMREDNVEAGAVLTKTTMTTTAMTTTTGSATEMPDGVRDEFKALLERDEAKFAPLGCRGVGGGRGGDAGGGSTRVVLDAPMTTARVCGFTIRGRRSGGRRRRTTTTTVTIRERGTRTRGRGNDDDDYDYNYTGRGRRNAKGR
jgi:hypothetical protein